MARSIPRAGARAECPLATIADVQREVQISSMRADFAIVGVSLVCAFTQACTVEPADLPCVTVLPGWETPEKDGLPREAFVQNLVSVEDQVIRWNGVAIDDETLIEYLLESKALVPVPWIRFDPGSADCATGVRVRDLIDRNYPCREGCVCGQGDYRTLWREGGSTENESDVR